MTSHSAELAQFVEQLQFKDLPTKVVDSAACALIDHLAAGLYGAGQPWTRIVAELAMGEGEVRGAKSVIYGRKEKINALRAARINGTAAHGFELDDIYEPGLTHPGAVVLSAAIALGAELGIDGKRLIEATVCGYEVMCRVAASVVHLNSVKGFHSVGTIGPFGAATAAGKMSGLTAAEFLNSWGISNSFAGGTKAFSTGGGMIKRLHAGRSAEGGIFAVQLTKRGFSGPPHGLDGRLGFLETFFDGQARLELLTEGLGKSFTIENLYLKPYASCGVTHSVIQKILDLKRANDFAPSKVDQIIVGSSKRGKNQNSVPNPTDTMSAQYSLECSAALAALGEAANPSSFEPARFTRPDVQAMMKKVQVVLDDEVEAIFPEHLGCRVTIRLQGGKEYTVFERDMPRHENLASQRKAAEEKFRVLSRNYLTAAQQDKVLAEVDRLANGGSAEALSAAL